MAARRCGWAREQLAVNAVQRQQSRTQDGHPRIGRHRHMSVGRQPMIKPSSSVMHRPRALDSSAQGSGGQGERPQDRSLRLIRQHLQI